jgi:hypothetical protein
MCPLQYRHTSPNDNPVISEISDRFSKNTQISVFMKILLVGAVAPCGRADGQIDMIKLIVAFRNFATAPEKRTHAY